MTSFTRVWDATYESVPADGDAASEGASRIRQAKVDVREREAVDHSWAGDANDGAHKKVTLLEQAGNPTSAANTGFLYTKDVATVTELFWEDSSGAVLQLTTAGALNAAALLAAANIFTGVNTIRSSDGGAGEIVALDLDRASASPAANDLLMALRWLMRDGGAGTDVAVKLLAKLLDPTAASEDAELEFHTVQAGVLTIAAVLGKGLRLGAPTGGDPAAGFLNAAGGVKVNNVDIGDWDALTLVDNPANSSFVPLSIGAGVANDRKARVGEVGGWVPLEVQTAAASASLDFVLTSYLTDFEDFMFVLDHLVPATDAVDLWMRFSTNGGVSYDAGASAYAYTGLGETSALITGVSAGDTKIVLTGAPAGNAAGEFVSGEVLLRQPALTTDRTSIRYHIDGQNSTPHPTVFSGSGHRLANQDTDAARFLMSSGNISTGKITLLGRRKVT